MSKQPVGAQIVVGGQWGDEGKGLISAYLAARDKALLVCRAGVGPNAEHGVFLSDDSPYIRMNQLPLGWMFNPDSQIRIGSGVVVNPTLLFEEADRFGLRDRIKVDYRCPIVTAKHIAAEKNSKKMGAIGSTFSGSGYCRADFALRVAKQAKDIKELQPYLTDVGAEVNAAAAKGMVGIESSQGTYLSLALSDDYPNVTSDNVTAMAAGDDVLLNWRKLREVILVVKTMPTREGAGSLGSEEISQKELDKMGLLEKSSIGDQTRRKAKEINWEMLAYSAEVNGATQIALTFCEQYDPEVKNISSEKDITPKLQKLIRRVEKVTGVPVTLLNTGKPFSAMVDLTGGSLDWTAIKKRVKQYEPKA